jgi:hypothetical protein
MAITRSQMARQLLSIGGMTDDNLRSLGIGMLGAPLTDLAPAGILGTGSMLAGNINRPTSGYETKEKKEEIDKAYEKYEKEGLFEDLGIDPKDLRSQQMKEIENQLALGPISIGTGIYGTVKSAGGIGAFLKNMAKQKAGKELTKKTVQGILAAQAKAEAEAIARERAALDQYFGGSGDTTGDRFDGADSFESYSAEPTAYSGSS